MPINRQSQLFLVLLYILVVLVIVSDQHHALHGIPQRQTIVKCDNIPKERRGKTIKTNFKYQVFTFAYTDSLVDLINRYNMQIKEINRWQQNHITMNCPLKVELCENRIGWAMCASHEMWKEILDQHLETINAQITCLQTQPGRCLPPGIQVPPVVNPPPNPYPPMPPGVVIPPGQPQPPGIYPSPNPYPPMPPGVVIPPGQPQQPGIYPPPYPYPPIPPRQEPFPPNLPVCPPIIIPQSRHQYPPHCLPTG